MKGLPTNTLTFALSLITKGYFMRSIELKDANYSVPIHPEHKKLVRLKRTFMRSKKIYKAPKTGCCDAQWKGTRVHNIFG